MQNYPSSRNCRTAGRGSACPPVVGGQAVARSFPVAGIPSAHGADEIKTILTSRTMEERIVGQSHALEAIAQSIRTSRAQLGDPRRPIGVFFMVGPSGVGKTESALALSDILYGGDRNMVVINMSEYKESHKISRLTGSAPGYVGYGEGGASRKPSAAAVQSSCSMKSRRRTSRCRDSSSV